MIWLLYFFISLVFLFVNVNSYSMIWFDSIWSLFSFYSAFISVYSILLLLFLFIFLLIYHFLSFFSFLFIFKILCFSIFFILFILSIFTRQRSATIQYPSRAYGNTLLLLFFWIFSLEIEVPCLSLIACIFLWFLLNGRFYETMGKATLDKIDWPGRNLCEIQYLLGKSTLSFLL